MQTRSFSNELQNKINSLKCERKAIELGRFKFSSPLILAPMAGICTAPFRLLMEDLGAGATVSELISATGILHGNQKTLDMLHVDEREENIGIQIFGEDANSLAKACQVVERTNAKFIDLNMGCPVKKVVHKGAGSALMKEIESLAPIFRSMKQSVKIPVSIKIRTGWDSESLNADKIIDIAHNEGIEWVAIHGRSRAQQYTGLADWSYIEQLAKNSSLPIIGNGDLHQPIITQRRLKETHCRALMIARGCLRNPFIFLESFNPNLDKKSLFFGSDYFEVIERLYNYTLDCFQNQRARLIQMRKLIVWFAAGFPNAAQFRAEIFKINNLEETMLVSEKFFKGLNHRQKNINYDEVFMNSGHG